MAIQINNTTVIYDDQVVKVSANTTLNRPNSPVQGMIRYNTTDSTFEGYNGTAWGPIGGAGGGGTGLAKYTQDIGDGVSAKITVTHSLASTNLLFTVISNFDGDIVYPDITILNTNQVDIGFSVSSAPAVNQYKVMIAKL